MNADYVHALCAGSIAVWATWCVLSRKVDDGVIGKIIYAIIAISGYAILARSDGYYFSTRAAETTMYIGVSLACARHWFMKTFWTKTKRWICVKIKCDHCAKCPKSPADIAQGNKKF